MLGAVQNFINEVSLQVNKRDNPLGLSAGQIDEINQILTLIKAIISDGIQRGDISKMVVLMGEMAEHMPELKPEIDDIIKDLKKLSKKLFENPDQLGIPNPQGVDHAILGIEAGLANTQDAAMASVAQPISGSNPQGGLDVSVDPKLLLETQEDRSKVAEKSLNFVNDNMILSQANFDALSKGLKRIQNRAGVQANVNSEKIDGVSTANFVDDYRIQRNSQAGG